jgi:mono/diheme cytochrome c family protein
MRRLALLALLVPVAAACGGGPSVSGRAVFSRACANCHTLTGHDTNVDGGDLAVGRLSVREVESFTRIMPVHLSRDELRAVSRYVVSKEK